MLELGIIEPSCSPWTSPIVMVPKPVNTLRFCNDFRKLNDVSTFDGYPMPRVDELLDRLGKARYISTFDLTKGYWKLPLSPSSREKMAFSTPSGHWQYRVLPFGLHGAPATFQRLMDVICRPHQEYAAAYLNDVVIHSESWEAHLERLGRVLMDFKRAGLKAKPRKCHLGLTEGELDVRGQAGIPDLEEGPHILPGPPRSGLQLPLCSIHRRLRYRLGSGPFPDQERTGASRGLHQPQALPRGNKVCGARKGGPDHKVGSPGSEVLTLGPPLHPCYGPRTTTVDVKGEG